MGAARRSFHRRRAPGAPGGYRWRPVAAGHARLRRSRLLRSPAVCLRAVQLSRAARRAPRSASRAARAQIGPRRGRRLRVAGLRARRPRPRRAGAGLRQAGGASSRPPLASSSCATTTPVCTASPGSSIMRHRSVPATGAPAEVAMAQMRAALLLETVDEGRRAHRGDLHQAPVHAVPRPAPTSGRASSRGQYRRRFMQRLR